MFDKPEGKSPCFPGFTAAINLRGPRFAPRKGELLFYVGRIDVPKGSVTAGIQSFPAPRRSMNMSRKPVVQQDTFCAYAKVEYVL